MPGVAVVRGPELLRYSFPGGHPLSEVRLKAFFELLDKEVQESNDGVFFVKPTMASEEELLLFHTRDYVEFVKKRCEDGYGYLDYGDTPAFKNCYEAASYVVGSTLELCRMVLNGRTSRGFNPMGGLHHARRGAAGGFCIFNDIGVAIHYLLDKKGLNRVAYVDIDCHHGDGVCYDFYNDPRVIFADIHQDGRTLYPGTGFEHETGEGKAKGLKLNIPLPPYSGDREFLEAFNKVINFLENYDFDIILFQTGADGLAGDPITNLQYSPKAHAYAAEKLTEMAEEKCGGNIVAMGGGGYNPNNVAAAWVNVVRKLAER
ncbi:MAG TPA: acetoin utilization protein AcuC [Candidatus Caldiarchaeum subterraneum]|uniref:Acetoin utilization protein AcuC n=1 Tax=Caldiarchaeum subterraneum TaxID=311458 RepID=A0A832ZVD5_CALS0|nr:acetoin utilization protein AcuC [Candidatus Caldarchaeum subterraneum]